MARKKQSPLELVARGFSGSISAGKYPDPFEPAPDKAGKRIQFRLTLEMPNASPADRERAEEAWARLEAMRDALVKAQRGPEAEALLRDAAKHVSEPELFDMALRVGALIENQAPRTVAGDWDTWGKVGRAWTSGALARRFPHKRKIDPPKDPRKENGIIEYLSPFIGNVPVAAFNVGHYNLAMGSLPSRCQSDAAKRHYHQVIMRVMRLAQKTRLITTWLLDEIEPFVLDRKKAPTFTCLEPEDLGALLPSPNVDLRWRLLWGFMVYESPRIGKLRELTWYDFSWTGHGMIKTDSKSGEFLQWSLRPGTLAALAAVRERYPDLRGPFTWMTDADVQLAAKRLRRHLTLAGRHDPRLHESKGRRRKIRAHDTRATFVVFSKLEGRSESWIMDRTGHTSSEMIQRYDRLSRAAQGAEWAPLGRLDVALGLDGTTGPGRRLGEGPEGGAVGEADELLGEVVPARPALPEGGLEPGAVQVSDPTGPDADRGPGGSVEAGASERSEVARAASEQGAAGPSVTVGVTVKVPKSVGAAEREAQVMETVHGGNVGLQFRRLESNQNQGIQRPLIAGESQQNSAQHEGCDAPEGSGSVQVSQPVVTPRAAYAARLKEAMHAAIEAETFSDVGALSTLFAAATEAAGGAAVVELALRRRGRTG